jgi:uncharacterized protein (DUF2236 family)
MSIDGRDRGPRRPSGPGTSFKEMVGPGPLTWRVNGEAVLLLGGGRALILQVAHPGVAAGVAEFSDYRRDPWRRLYRTLDTTLTIVFGDPPSSRAASERLRRVHERVAGTDDRGAPYRALDPELLLWVHATLIDTSLTIYERYVKRLGATEISRYYEEMKDLGEAYSIPRDAMPTDYADFRRYWEAMLEGGLRVTETTRDVADAVLRPDVPPLAWPAVELLRLVTVGLLPPGLRGELGLSWGPGRERALAGSQLAARGLLPVLPALVRRFPSARAEIVRVA